MAMTPPTAGELRANLRFERRSDERVGGGAVKGAWSELIETTRAKLSPTRGGEEVMAGRMSGSVSMDIWIRSSRAARDLNHGDRAIDVNTDRIYNLGQPIDPFGNQQWLLIQATASGMADPSLTNFNFVILEDF